MFGCGDTIEMPKSGLATPHLWIIVTTPDEQTGYSVLVNVTTHRSHSDPTVVLKVGDHSYIRHDSTIYYADARIIDVRLIEQGIKGGHPYIRQDATCSTELLKRVQAGIHKSPFTPKKICTFCSKFF